PPTSAQRPPYEKTPAPRSIPTKPTSTNKPNARSSPRSAAPGSTSSSTTAHTKPGTSSYKRSDTEQLPRPPPRGRAAPSEGPVRRAEPATASTTRPTGASSRRVQGLQATSTTRAGASTLGRGNGSGAGANSVRRCCAPPRAIAASRPRPRALRVALVGALRRRQLPELLRQAR